MTRKRILLSIVMAVPLIVGGALAYLHTQADDSYICPITGEKLPCPKCCPLNHGH